MKNNISFDGNFPDFEQFTSSFKKDDSTSFSNSENSNNSWNNQNNPFENIDMNTILKMKQIIDNMNKNSNSPRANLLLSLKPYLKPSRKQKVDQYIQLFNMGDLLGSLNISGGEEKK